MRSLIILMILIVGVQGYTQNIQNKKTKKVLYSDYYNLLDSNCNNEELPTSCKTKDIEVNFLFTEQNNRIVVKTNKKEWVYPLQQFFEGLDYEVSFFEKKENKLIIIRLDYENSSTFVVFRINADKTYYLGDIIQEDMLDNNNELVINHAYQVEDLQNGINIYIGNKNKLKTHRLLFNGQKELTLN